MAEELRPEIPRFDETAQQEILNLASRLAAADSGKVTQSELERIGEDIGLSGEHVRTAIGLYEAKRPMKKVRSAKGRVMEWVEMMVIGLHFVVLVGVTQNWLESSGAYRFAADGAVGWLLALCIALGLLVRGSLNNLFRSTIAVASSMVVALTISGLYQKLHGVETVGSDWPRFAAILLAYEFAIFGLCWLGGRGLRALVRRLNVAYLEEEKARP